MFFSFLSVAVLFTTLIQFPSSFFFTGIIFATLFHFFNLIWCLPDKKEPCHESRKLRKKHVGSADFAFGFPFNIRRAFSQRHLSHL